jgi:hypothetical protein
LTSQVTWNADTRQHGLLRDDGDGTTGEEPMRKAFTEKDPGQGPGETGDEFPLGGGARRRGFPLP